MSSLSLDGRMLDTIGAFYEALTDTGQWGVAVEKLRVLCDAEAANFGVFDPTSATPVISANQGAWTDQAMAEYIRDFMPLDPAPGHFARLPAETLASTEQLSLGEAHRRGVFYNEFLRPRGLTECVAGRLADIPRGVSLVSIHRSVESKAFSAAEIACFGRTLPHIARAFQLRRLLERQDVAAAGLMLAVDRLTVGLVVLDADGEAIHVNLAARELAARGDGLRLTRNGRLRADHPAADARLHVLQQAVLAGGAGGVARVERTASAHAYAVLVSPLPANVVGGAGGPGHRGVLMAISDPDRRAPSSAALLGAAFGLTPKGAQLVAALADGDDLAAYAERHAIALNTCRFQLKTVFAQMGVHSQSELVRLAVRALADLALRG